jgi:hypothetical protein
MSGRDAINFAKSPTGAFLGFCLLLGFVLFMAKGFQPSKSKSSPLSFVTKASADVPPPQTIQAVQNKGFTPMKIPASPNPDPAREAQPVSGTAAVPAPEILPLSLFAETPEPEPKQLSKDYAPYGRLIPCELIVTVDSAAIRTPIIGLITEDVYHGGRLIIPAGTEVHGTAQTDRTRERIASGNSWTLVWKTGEELPLSGIALDRETDSDGQGWGITDGSAGLRGRLIKTDDLAEIKLFAATFLSGAASLLAERQETIFGNSETPSLGNAPLEGAQSVLGAYAQQIYDSIQRDGFYVRVPAGKQFYLYVTQTIDKADAAFGETRLNPSDPQPTTNQFSTTPPQQPSRFAVPVVPFNPRGITP